MTFCQLYDHYVQIIDGYAHLWSQGLKALPALEDRILEIIRRNPAVTQKELAFEAKVARNTAMGVVSALIQKGLIRDRGYYVSHASMPLGFVLIKSPDDSSKIKQLEEKLDRYKSIGSWGMISDANYDYVFFLWVGNNNPNLIGFFSDIRATIGPKSETHFIISKF